MHHHHHHQHYSAGPPRRQHGPPQPCIYFLRGFCRFGAACRFSHDPQQQAGVALPFHLRRAVLSQANAGQAAAAGAAASSPWLLRVMSYNVLADCLAHEHAAELYSSAPRYSLEWGYRSGLILREILHNQPDVLCLQEVDHFSQFAQALQPHGYEGMYTKRTGDRHDGLAVFWRTGAVRPVKQCCILFNQFGLKDNVAQLVVFHPCHNSSGSRGKADDSSSEASTSSAGSMGSLSGQKRRQREVVNTSSGRQHLRFDSGSEGEEAAGAAARPDSSKRRGSAAALESLSIEDAVEMEQDVLAAGGTGSSTYVEDATEAVEDAAADGAAGSAAAQLPALVVANIHVLFNPRRGDLKLGQVRTLLEHVDSLCLQQQKRTGQRAAAIICGDFNSAAGSPIYNFVRQGQLELSQCDRKRMSGQVESRGNDWRALQQAFLAKQHHQQQFAPQPQQAQMAEQAAPRAPWEPQGPSGSRWQTAEAEAWPGQLQPLGVDEAVASITGYPGGNGQQVVPPYAPAEDPSLGYGRRSHKPPRAWTLQDVRIAAGSSCSPSEAVARHPLQLDSAYRALTGCEAAYSTCHDKFIGTVDYIWFTPESSDASSGWRLLPLGVLQPPPLDTLHCALPSPAWPSDHISLACDFALLPAAAGAGQPQQARKGKAHP